MNRRTVLGAGGFFLLTGATGCIRDSEDSDSNGSEDDSGTGDATDETTDSNAPTHLGLGEAAILEDGTALMVSTPSVQKSVISSTPDFLVIEREDGLQFLVVDVTGHSEIDPSTFVLDRDGHIQEPPRSQQQIRTVVGECQETCIAIPVAVESVEEAAVVYQPNAEPVAVWELDDTTVADLSKVPDLNLQQATIVDHEGDVGIEFVVENGGDRDGGFRALVAPAWVADITDPVGFTVPQGDTVTETVVPNELQNLDPDEAGFREEPTEDTRYFEVESTS